MSSQAQLAQLAIRNPHARPIMDTLLEKLRCNVYKEFKTSITVQIAVIPGFTLGNSSEMSMTFKIVLESEQGLNKDQLATVSDLIEKTSGRLAYVTRSTCNEEFEVTFVDNGKESRRMYYVHPEVESDAVPKAADHIYHFLMSGNPGTSAF